MDFTIYDRIKTLNQLSLKSRSLNQLERELGLPRNAINNYKNGGVPSVERVFKISKYFNVSMEYLIGQEKYYSTVEEYFNQLSSESKMEIFNLCNKWIIECFKEGKEK